MTRTRFLILSAVLISNLSCANVFQAMAPKTSDAVYYMDAKMAMDAFDYSGVITKIGLMSAAYRNQRHVQVLLASAYAGRCGLEFIGLIDTLQNSGSSDLVPTLFSAMTHSTVSKISDCISSEDVLMGIARVYGTPTDDEWLMRAFVGLAKIGAIANYYGDHDTGTAADDGDNTIDPAFDACDDTKLSPAMAEEIAFSISQVYQALQAVSTAGSTIGADQLNDLNPICSLVGGFCTATQKSDLNSTAAHRAARAFLAEDTDGLGFGLNTCAVQSLATCYALCTGT